MLQRFPIAAWITLSVTLVAAGVFVRFNGTYLVSDQLILGMLFFVAAFMLTVALICWLPLLRRLPDDRAAGRTVLVFVFAPATTVALLVSMAFESPSASAARQRAHLMKVARIVADDYAARGRMPAFFDDALDRSRETLANRGDANGRALVYRRIDADSAMLCAPECRIHIVIRGEEIRYLPWPKGKSDPCGNGSDASYWAGDDPVLIDDAPQ